MPPSIRLATPDDAEQVQAIYAPYCHTPISFELEPPSIEEVRSRLMKVLGPYPWLLLEDGGEVLGYAYAAQHRERAAYRWSVDTSVYVRQDRRRRGVGRALYTSLLDLLPLQGYVNAYAGVTLPNPASVGLHEAMGVSAGRRVPASRVQIRRLAGRGLVSKALQPRPDEPPLPKRLDEVQHTAAWAEALNRGRFVLR